MFTNIILQILEYWLISGLPCQASSIRKSERPVLWTLTNPKVHKANIFLMVSLNLIKLTSYVIPCRFVPVYFVDFPSLSHKMARSRLPNILYFTKIAQILRE